jgi:hypothetical protein
MSQEEVYEIIRKSKYPICKFQIQKKTKLSDNLLTATLLKLLKNKDIKCIELDRHQAAERTQRRVTRRMRFFYI